jgi:hypothetical protein
MCVRVRILRRAAFPANLFRTLMIESRQVESVIEHRLYERLR